MPPPWAPLWVLPPGPAAPRFVCYCEEAGDGAEGPGGPSLCVTDGAALWSSRCAPAALAALKARLGLGAAGDVAPRCRAAPEQQPVTVTVQEAGASLTLSAGPPALEFELPKVPGPEAASRLQALTLSLAERVCALERRLAAAEEIAASPKKSPWPVGPQQFLPDPDSQRGCPGPGAKRRCPGESLINPGFKSKKPASGVDFDDL